MSDVQITIGNQSDAQVVSASLQETQVTVAVPGIQGPVGVGVPSGGTTNQVLFKQSNTSYDTAWGAITSAMIGDLQIVNADVSASAGIAYSKLATLTSGNIVLGNASNVATSTAVTGDVTISNAGVTAISSGVIVDADVNASAAIAGTKISPNFGSQNVTTTGTSTAASFIPTSSTAPTNGLYLSAANSVALSTNGTGKLFIDTNGNVTLIGAGTGARYLALLNETSTYAGSYILQAGGGSAGFGGAITMYGHSHATYPGSVYIGASAGSGGSIILGTNNALDPSSGRLRITSTGQLSHIGAGSVGSPAVSFSGSAASNSLVVDSNSRVGIGTSGPLYRLQVEASSNTAYSTSSRNSLVGLYNPSTTAGAYAGIEIQAAGVGNASLANLTAIDVGSGSTDFAIGLRNSNVFEEKFRITSAGSVGIGTSSPSVRLQVQDSIAGGSDGTVATLHNFSDTGGDTRYVGLNFRIGSDNGTSAIRAYRTNSASNYETNLSFWTNPAGATQTPLRAMTIDSYQRVGIGTTSPTYRVHASGTTSIIKGDSAGASSTAPSLDLYDSTHLVDVILTPASGTGIVGTYSTHPFTFYTNNQPRATIDTSGRLLVGTSSVRQVWQINPTIQAESTAYTHLSLVANSTNAAISPIITFARSRGNAVGGTTAVVQDDSLGVIGFAGAQNSAIDALAASITCAVDSEVGTAGDTTDVSGRLVFSTTLDGANGATEALRITNDRVVCYNQPAPTSKSAAATLTVAELKTGIIQYTGAAATLTLPTGTLTEGGFSGIYTNMTFEWSVINTGSGTCTIGAGTDHTIVGAATVAAGDSGRFASRRTAANTFVSYRLS